MCPSKPTLASEPPTPHRSSTCVARALKLAFEAKYTHPLRPIVSASIAPQIINSCAPADLLSAVARPEISSFQVAALFIGTRRLISLTALKSPSALGRGCSGRICKSREQATRQEAQELASSGHNLLDQCVRPMPFDVPAFSASLWDKFVTYLDIGRTACQFSLPRHRLERYSRLLLLA